VIELPIKTLETKRQAMCASTHVAGKRRKAESRNDIECVVKERRPAEDRGKASRVKDGGSEMDEVEMIHLPAETLETKRKATRKRVWIEVAKIGCSQ
jgi:hypothetical protein